MRPRHVVASAALVGLAILAGAAAVLATAMITDRLVSLFAVGAAVELTVAAAGLAVVLRTVPRKWVSVGVLAAVTLAVSAAAVGVPLPDHEPPVPAVPGQSWWRLDSGSTLRYVHVPARPPDRGVPIVFLHGGPGVADLPGDASYFGRLAADGFDVYVYDQLGAGGSARLDDPSGYTIERDVRDLEQIRRRIGARRIILIGHSYGGVLAAHYIATHPGQVAKVVLISPGPLDPADASGARAKSGLGIRATAQTYAAVLAPRALLAYTLLQVNPQAAHRYFGDREADARNDRVLRLSAAARHCREDHTERPATGAGFYRLQYPQSATAPVLGDVRPALAGNPTPALVLKGRCDYLSWQSALDYTTALTHARLRYLPDAGHNLYQDRPAETLAIMRAFLLDRSPPAGPDSTDAGTTAPPDYRGPH